MIAQVCLQIQRPCRNTLNCCCCCTCRNMILLQRKLCLDHRFKARYDSYDAKHTSRLYMVLQTTGRRLQKHMCVHLMCPRTEGCRLALLECFAGVLPVQYISVCFRARGAVDTLGGTAQRRPFQFVVRCVGDA